MQNTISMQRRALLRAGAAGLLAGWAGMPAQAKSQVTRVLVGFPPGGAIDVTARVYASAVKDSGTWVVENRAGAAGNIAASALALSPAGESVMMMAPLNVYCLSTTLYSNLAFDPQRDFAPVGIVATFPWAMAVNADVPANTVAEFVDWARAHPDRALCGMAAVGSEGHLMAYAFSREARFPLTFVPYRGGAPMSQDLIAGQIPLAFDPIVNLAPAHKAGKIKVLAITGAERSPLLPQVPTFAELKYQGATGETWIGVSVPRSADASRIQSLSQALLSAGQAPAVRSKLADIGLTARTEGPGAMQAAMAADTQRYAALARELDLHLN